VRSFWYSKQKRSDDNVLLYSCALFPKTLVSKNVSMSLSSAVALAAAQQPLSVTQQQQDAVLDFVGRRLEQLLIDAGVSAEPGEPCRGRDCV
jgi:hypothetical protein